MGLIIRLRKKNSMMRKATAKIVILTLALGCVVWFIFLLTSEATSESGFELVSKGMTEAQVRGILGVPHGVRRDPDKITYAYGGFTHFRWCTMEVFFDKTGLVVSKFHDH
ncbi:MAG: outer membrane protein assembly factor BamE [Akkermansiaceae bacterium]|nr:outer membrane protein assembly factor BamE [Akkermansiaceae bacterium]